MKKTERSYLKKNADRIMAEKLHNAADRVEMLALIANWVNPTLDSWSGTQHYLEEVSKIMTTINLQLQSVEDDIAYVLRYLTIPEEAIEELEQESIYYIPEE